MRFYPSYLGQPLVLFQRAINNLLANAIRHTPPGGTITLSVRPQENGQIQIQVMDSG